jgi:bacteriocin-like protein
MSKKSIETPKPDDLIKPKTKDGKTELTELSEEELQKVSGGTGCTTGQHIQKAIITV